MPQIRCRGGSARHASAMTTALSPERTMLIQMILRTWMPTGRSPRVRIGTAPATAPAFAQISHSLFDGALSARVCEHMPIKRRLAKMYTLALQCAESTSAGAVHGRRQPPTPMVSWRVRLPSPRRFAILDSGAQIWHMVCHYASVCCDSQRMGCYEQSRDWRFDRIVCMNDGGNSAQRAGGAAKRHSSRLRAAQGCALSQGPRAAAGRGGGAARPSSATGRASGRC